MIGYLKAFSVFLIWACIALVSHYFISDLIFNNCADISSSTEENISIEPAISNHLSISNEHGETILKFEIDSENTTKAAFIKNGGKKGAALNALSFWLDKTDFLDKQALLKAVSSHKHAEKLMRAIQTTVTI